MNNNSSSANINLNYKNVDDHLDEKELKTVTDILKKINEHNSIQIENIECVAGSKDGDNYMSVVKRINIIGKKNFTEHFTQSLILKRPIPCDKRRTQYRCDEAFMNEINAYTYVIPKLYQFEKNLPLPKCFHAGAAKNMCIILNDLCTNNYKIANRSMGLNYQHCKIIMKRLGQFHGTSIAMKILQPKQFSLIVKEMTEIVYCKEASAFYSMCLDLALNSAVKSCKQSVQLKCSQSNKLTDAIKKMNKMAEGNLYDNMRKCILDNKNDKLNVICHGDLWINNIMFKYDDNDTTVTDVKFIDLQAMRYTSPVTDLLQFFYSTTTKDLRDNYINYLLDDYCKSLLHTVRTHCSLISNNDVNEKNLSKLNEIEMEFTTENILKEYNAKSIYGFGTSIWLLPVVTFDSNNGPNLNNVTINSTTTDTINNAAIKKEVTDKLTPEYHTRIKDIVLEFYDKKLI